MKPNCYECEHRRNVPGDAHSMCVHPEAGGGNEILAILQMMGLGVKVESKLKVVGNRHGIMNGWFMHPINFDPAWLESCNGFTEKKNDGQVQ